MSRIFVSLYNRKVCKHTHEWLERVEDAPWDRWMQLGLVAHVRLVDDEDDIGDFLDATTREKVIEFLADNIADAQADDSRSHIKDTFEDLLRHGSVAYEESTDYELYKELMDYFDREHRYPGSEAFMAFCQEVRAQKAIADTLR